MWVPYIKLYINFSYNNKYVFSILLFLLTLKKPPTEYRDIT